MFGFNISVRLLLITDLALGKNGEPFKTHKRKKNVSVALWQYKSHLISSSRILPLWKDF